MASQLQPYSVQAPGFAGVNSQDALVDLSQSFALIAENAVIDKFGRIGARKGWEKVTTNTNADLTTNPIKCVGELILGTGVSTYLAAGSLNLFKITGASLDTLTTLTYGGGGAAPTIAADNWQFSTLNNVAIFSQRGHDTLIYDPGVSTTTYRRLSERAGAAGVFYQSHIGVTAFGRLWIADTTADKVTIRFSDGLAPHVMTGGSSGSLDTRTVWPLGGDQVVAIGAHNSFLYIFGLTQVLIYSGADDPSTMTLNDTLTGIGCIGRDTVQSTGDDLLFLSRSGVLSMKRTVQEKSQPIRDLSMNIRTDMMKAVSLDDGDDIKSVYNAGEAFYLLYTPTARQIYCFDMRRQLDNGSARATIWISLLSICFCTLSTGELYLGRAGCVAQYAGYLDNLTNYNLRYYTPWIDYGNPIALTIFKRALITVVGAGAKSIVIKWAFDYSSKWSSFTFADTSNVLSEYTVAEYGLSEYSGGAYDAIEIPVPGSGSGKVLQVGITATISGRALSIQRFDVFAKEGRV